MSNGLAKKAGQSGWPKYDKQTEKGMEMQTYSLPVTNEKLMSFHIEFIGTDSLGGERHFLEHTMLNSNKTLKKEELHRQLTFLGDELFNACTSQERIMFSGTYLKSDEQKVWDLLRPVLNQCLFLEDEVQKERKIILEEFQMGKDQIFQQLWVTIGKMLGHKLSVIGSEESIKAIGRTDLVSSYEDMIREDHAKMFLQNCEPPEDLFQIHSDDNVGLKVIVPIGKHLGENKNMSSSVVFHTFDVGFSFSALLLEDYLQSASGPLFKNIREKRQLCYMVGGSTDFCGDFQLSPYFSTYVVSDSDIDQAGEALMEEFKVDDVSLYDSLRVKHTLEMEKNKATFHGQMGLRRRSLLTGIAVDSLIEAIPTWEEFKKYGDDVKSKHLGSFKVIGTKK